MEQFLEQLTERIKQKRSSLEERGFEGEELNQRTAEWFNTLMEKYYGELMEIMAEKDYQAYRGALEAQDGVAFQNVLAKYEQEIKILQRKIITDAQ